MFKKWLNRCVFFLGWILSPFTLWNDALVNIPLSYALARLIIRFIKFNFLYTILALYWASNIFGILLMYVSGRELLKYKKDLSKNITHSVIAVIIYTVILIILYRMGLLKPAGPILQL